MKTVAAIAVRKKTHIQLFFFSVFTFVCSFFASVDGANSTTLSRHAHKYVDQCGRSWRERQSGGWLPVTFYGFWALISVALVHARTHKRPRCGHLWAQLCFFASTNHMGARYAGCLVIWLFKYHPLTAFKKKQKANKQKTVLTTNNFTTFVFKHCIFHQQFRSSIYLTSKSVHPNSISPRAPSVVFADQIEQRDEMNKPLEILIFIINSWSKQLMEPGTQIGIGFRWRLNGSRKYGRK